LHSQQSVLESHRVALTRLFFDNCAVGLRGCDAGFSGCAAAQPYRKEDQAGYG
jgi:hypothetical protein